jgi:para-aminobenzoate synthetase component 1
LTDFRHQINIYGKQRTPFVFLLDFDLQKPVILPLDEVNSTELLFDLNGFHNYRTLSTLPAHIDFQKNPPPFIQYQSAFEIALRHINYGNSYLLNLSAPTPIRTNLRLLEIFYHSQARYKVWFRDEFVCFSPEIFVQIADGKISSNPMKGTIDALLPHAAEIILADKKEYAEHCTIVDLIRNDLNIVSKKVRVQKFRYLDEIHTSEGKKLLQVSSKIVGELTPNFHENLGDILMALLPAGSISGAPKKKTLDIIAEAESLFQTGNTPYQRGYYTGICGYYDGNKLDSGVMIRFIENVQGDLYFKSGGGITAFSQAAAEYQELIQKVYVPIVRKHKM